MELAALTEKVMVHGQNLAALKGRIEDLERRTGTLERTGDLLNSVQITLTEVHVSNKFFGDKLEEVKTSLDKMNEENQANHKALGDRLEKLEGAGGAKWNALVVAVISALAAGLVGFAVGRLFM